MVRQSRAKKARAKNEAAEKSKKQTRKKTKKATSKNAAKVPALKTVTDQLEQSPNLQLFNAAFATNLAESAPHYATLFEEVRAVAMGVFERHVDQSDLNGLIPNEINNPAVLDDVCRSVYVDLGNHPTWKIDPNQFAAHCDRQVLSDDIVQQKKDHPSRATMNWLIADIYITICGAFGEPHVMKKALLIIPLVALAQSLSRTAAADNDNCDMRSDSPDHPFSVLLRNDFNDFGPLSCTRHSVSAQGATISGADNLLTNQKSASVDGLLAVVHTHSDPSPAATLMGYSVGAMSKAMIPISFSRQARNSITATPSRRARTARLR